MALPIKSAGLLAIYELDPWASGYRVLLFVYDPVSIRAKLRAHSIKVSFRLINGLFNRLSEGQF